MALTAALIVVVLAWHTHRPAPSRQDSWDDVMAEAGSGGYAIISTEELADRYHKEGADLLLVDTRQEWEFRTGHIKGALNFPIEPTWLDRLRKADKLKDVLGPDKHRVVVFY